VIAGDRRALAALAAAGLVWLASSLGDGGNRKGVTLLGVGQRVQGHQQDMPPAISPPAPAQPATPRAPSFPFEYFGQLTEQGETKVLLHGGGRVLAVRGPGPLLEDWNVDELHEHLLVVRHVPSGTRYQIELATRRYDLTPQSPDDSPQD
jgi:hypothetical protein